MQTITNINELKKEVVDLLYSLTDAQIIHQFKPTKGVSTFDYSDDREKSIERILDNNKTSRELTMLYTRLSKYLKKDVKNIFFTKEPKKTKEEKEQLLKNKLLQKELREIKKKEKSTTKTYITTLLTDLLKSLSDINIILLFTPKKVRLPYDILEDKKKTIKEILKKYNTKEDRLKIISEINKILINPNKNKEEEAYKRYIKDNELRVANAERIKNKRNNNEYKEEYNEENKINKPTKKENKEIENNLKILQKQKQNEMLNNLLNKNKINDIVMPPKKVNKFSNEIQSLINNINKTNIGEFKGSDMTTKDIENFFNPLLLKQQRKEKASIKRKETYQKNKEKNKINKLLKKIEGTNIPTIEAPIDIEEIMAKMKPKKKTKKSKKSKVSTSQLVRSRINIIKENNNLNNINLNNIKSLLKTMKETKIEPIKQININKIIKKPTKNTNLNNINNLIKDIKGTTVVSIQPENINELIKKIKKLKTNKKDSKKNIEQKTQTFNKINAVWQQYGPHTYRGREMHLQTPEETAYIASLPKFYSEATEQEIKERETNKIIDILEELNNDKNFKANFNLEDKSQKMINQLFDLMKMREEDRPLKGAVLYPEQRDRETYLSKSPEFFNDTNPLDEKILRNIEKEFVKLMRKYRQIEIAGID